MLTGYKTYTTAAIAVGYAIFAYLNHTIDAGQAGQLVETALLGAFIRSGIATSAKS